MDNYDKDKNYNISKNDNKQDLSSKYDSKSHKLINKNYICYLNNTIGSGTFGKVLYATSLDGKREYAIKFENSSVKTSLIEAENDIYQALKQGEGVPQIAWTGEYKKYKLMIMELLGPSLDKYFIFCNKKFSKLTTALIGTEMIKRVQYMHFKGFLHRDIKPNNFMLGKFSKNLDKLNEKTVYIIDFGLSKEYIDFKTNEHLPFKDGRRFIGTPRYASIGTHLGYRQSRRDDLESIAYIVIYFILGELPWQGIKAKSKSVKKEKILEIKHKCDFKSEKNLPKELIIFLEYCKNLGYDEKPDYKYIYKLFNIMIGNFADGDFEINRYIWDWNLQMLAAHDNQHLYKSLSTSFKKLFEGYPVDSFDEYLKALSLHTGGSNINLPTTSSTTSNTNPNPNVCKDDSNLDQLNEDFKQIDLSKGLGSGNATGLGLSMSKKKLGK